ncbi:MAG TPA: alpha/beta fold hydrolase, partial [Acidimicrobiales bacterium]|nr:alpha/beta fold hydrolase [Acidimicrobiales bacterium]
MLVFHGTPGCRLLPQRVDDEARRIGVRILAPDRPGFGKSTFVPDRQMADWVADVVALADQGELSSFGLVGYSGGGPYSLLCAQVLPERVSAVACVAGVGPLDTAEARAAMPEATRAFYEAAAT